MTPEDRFDHLISRRLTEGSARPTTSDDAARLAAAEELARLRHISVPPTLASGLEARLRQAARDQQQRNRTGVLPLPGTRRGMRARRWVTGLTGAAALLVVVGVVMLNAASSSLPGDPLYSLKQFRNQLALAQAHTPTEHAQVAIQQVQAAVRDLQAEVAAGHSADAIIQALAVVSQDTHTAQTLVNNLPAGDARNQAQSDLAGALAAERATLRQLLPAALWPVRVALTSQLGALGDTVPVINQVSASPGNSSLTNLIIVGSNFASGIQVFVDGTPVTTIRSQSASQIAAGIDHDAWSGPTHIVGVQNPDGTAAQFTAPGYGSQSGNDTHDHKTPVPSGTPDDVKHHSHGTPSADPTPPDNGNHQ